MFDEGWSTSTEGQTLLRPFANAPFPHPSREKGHTYKETHFDAANHYSDSTVGIVIPPHFRPTESVDYIVHFHGWDNHVAHVLEHHALRRQLATSRRNAILLVPQGPKNASDSSGGKLEEPEMFEKLLQEVAEFLHSEGKVPTKRIGKVTLSAHSGGYRVASAILEHGGLRDHITDVFLFDASYGGLEVFAQWGKQRGRRLISLFTPHLASENFQLLVLLKKQGVAVDASLEPKLTRRMLSGRRPHIIHTMDLLHDEVIQKRDYFHLFLQSSWE